MNFELLVGFCVGIAGVGFGIFYRLKTRKTLQRMDEMLSAAVDGSFRQTVFDESVSSKIESKLARFLNGSAASAKNLEKERSSIQTLISDISHQTKTPIANLLLYLSLLSEQDLTPTQREQVEIACGQAEKLNFLIENLVKSSRLETGIITAEPKVQSIAPLIEQSIYQNSEKARDRGISLVGECGEQTAKFDRRWTEEALCNLVDNALKYTPRGGSVTVSAREFEMFCRIDVADNGIGIEEEEQAKVFGRFYRGIKVRGEDGLGIGLYLAREILQKQGGYIKVDSKPGEGSTFSLYLPKKLPILLE